jgi:hypothetical protein
MNVVRAQRFAAWLHDQELRARRERPASGEGWKAVVFTDEVLVYRPLDRLERLPQVSSLILVFHGRSLTHVTIGHQLPRQRVRLGDRPAVAGPGPLKSPGSSLWA